MIEFVGKYTTAKVMIDHIDETTSAQIISIINDPAFTDKIVIMPDTHAGAGSVIGFTMPMTRKIVPTTIGVDIGCGMLSMELDRNILDNISLDDFDKLIRSEVPFGTNVRKTPAYNFEKEFPWDLSRDQNKLLCLKFKESFGISMEPTFYDYKWFLEKCESIKMNSQRAINSIGTLGGGNHFIEVGISKNTGNVWITVHSGSRQFGKNICQYWQNLYVGTLDAKNKVDEDFLLTGYLTDMMFAQIYAQENRKEIIKSVISILDPDKIISKIESIHNYIDFNDFIIRKGAISSYKGQKMIIPFNMEDGILLCNGKSNEEWNFSAPHGAGRVFSRSAAKAKFSADIISQRMSEKGIYTSVVPADEVKEAYKDPKIIEDAILPTAEIIDRLTPVLNLKS
jgi:tRNA-splicing ligase RtcB (3'-phosphate/5'-hydroxy nucleic acid ligase)